MQRRFPDVSPLKDHRGSLDETAAAGVGGLNVSAAEVKQLLAERVANQWETKTDEDYEALTELAKAVTAAKYLEVQSDGEKTCAQGGTRGAFARGRRRRQGSPRNALGRGQAHQADQRSRGEGRLRAIRRRVRVRHGRQAFQGEGKEAGLQVSLIGGDLKFFIPLDDGSLKVAEGGRLLVVGMLTPWSIQYGDNPLKPSSARVIYSKVLVPIGM